MAKKVKSTASEKLDMILLLSDIAYNKDGETTSWGAMYNLLEEDKTSP